MSKKKLSESQVIYCREHFKSGDAEFGLKPLAEKFGVSNDVIKDIVHGKTYKEVGGTIHPTRPSLSREVKIQIARADDVAALAEKLGISPETIQKYAALLKPKKAKLTAELKAAIRAEYVPYSDEYGREALAAKYSVTPAQISQIVKGIRRERPKTPVPDFLKEAIIIAYDEEKLSVRRLAERFSLQRDTIKAVLKEAGIEIRKNRVDEETKQEIIEAFKSGQSLRQLEEIYGINRATMAEWVKPFKVTKPKKELTQELREQIYRYHSQGYGIGIIAKTIGISQGIVRKVIDGVL